MRKTDLQYKLLLSKYVHWATAWRLTWEFVRNAENQTAQIYRINTHYLGNRNKFEKNVIYDM